MSTPAKQAFEPLPGEALSGLRISRRKPAADRHRPTPDPADTAARPVRVETADSVAEHLQALGRTEDIKFSPDGRRLALAGFVEDRLLIIDVKTVTSATEISISLTDCIQVTSPGLNRPHGLSFLDANTLIVSNRRGKVTIFDLPDSNDDQKDYALEPVMVIGSDDSHGIESPGSVSATPLEDNRFEILVCNNYVHYVSRHILDRQEGLQLVSSEVLVGDGMKIPDGVTANPGNHWLATSVHDRHRVYLYRRRPSLDRNSRPDGILTYFLYPHGIRFTPDDRHLIVADAGTPYINIYTRTGDDWSGTHHPQAVVRVMDNETYSSGRISCQEGGTKGLDIDPGMNVLVTTCEKQVIRFFDLCHMLNQRGIPRDRRLRQRHWYYESFSREVLPRLPGFGTAWKILRRLLA